ncbi:hypothetical protein DWF00_09550 [Bosea caraganae]|nr:hypothetical protein DWF00_09550 [Bosea caraganae]
MICSSGMIRSRHRIGAAEARRARKAGSWFSNDTMAALYDGSPNLPRATQGARADMRLPAAELTH